jgi:hypothetical protein
MARALGSVAQAHGGAHGVDDVPSLA